MSNMEMFLFGAVFVFCGALSGVTFTLLWVSRPPKPKRYDAEKEYGPGVIRHGRAHWHGGSSLIVALVFGSVLSAGAQPSHGTLVVCVDQDAPMLRTQAIVMVEGERYLRIQRTDRRGCAEFSEMPIDYDGNLAYVYVLAPQWQQIVPVVVTSDQTLIVSQPAWLGWWPAR